MKISKTSLIISFYLFLFLFISFYLFLSLIISYYLFLSLIISYYLLKKGSANRTHCYQSTSLHLVIFGGVIQCRSTSSTTRNSTCRGRLQFDAIDFPASSEASNTEEDQEPDWNLDIASWAANCLLEMEHSSTTAQEGSLVSWKISCIGSRQEISMDSSGQDINESRQWSN